MHFRPAPIQIIASRVGGAGGAAVLVGAAEAGPAVLVTAGGGGGGAAVGRTTAGGGGGAQLGLVTLTGEDLDRDTVLCEVMLELLTWRGWGRCHRQSARSAACQCSS